VDGIFLPPMDRRLQRRYVGLADLLIHPAMIAKSWYSVGFSRMVFG